MVLFDRGYPSYEMFDFLDEKGLFFVIRLSSSYKEIQAINSNDTVLNYNFGTTSKKVRVIKIELPDGTIEMLATNIFDSNITTTLFKELYFLR
nr:transposase [Clostridium sp.]